MRLPPSCLFFLITISVSGVASSAVAGQTFTDEAGELLYTIDDQGMVSMFENSPGTDVTLSVTRGTREQMQPQVSEVIPEAVPAGSFTVLKLKGRNLVGAKIKLSVPGIEVKNHLGKPKEVDVPINVPLDLPPGEVTIEVTTPIGRATARFKTVEVQIGGSETRPDVITHPGMGYGADEGSGAIATTAPLTCPQGMVAVGGEMGGFCIEIDHTFKGDFREAERTCAKKGRRLCMVFEWQKACQLAAAGKAPMKNMHGEWEWTGGFEIVLDDTQQDTAYFLFGKSGCEAKRNTMRIDAEKFAGRCCKSP